MFGPFIDLGDLQYLHEAPGHVVRTRRDKHGRYWNQEAPTKRGVNFDVPNGVLGSFFYTHSLYVCSIVSWFTCPYFCVLAVYTHAIPSVYFLDSSCRENDISL